MTIIVSQKTYLSPLGHSARTIDDDGPLKHVIKFIRKSVKMYLSLFCNKENKEKETDVNYSVDMTATITHKIFKYFTEEMNKYESNDAKVCFFSMVTRIMLLYNVHTVASV